VSTQVIEAGVDIDMDLGFKDRSLLDSDEQLAGRINRNALKQDSKVFLFDCDSTKTIYGQDERYKLQQKDKDIYFGFKDILRDKTFDILYQKVFEDAVEKDWTDKGKMDGYFQNFKHFDFQNISNVFKLIDDNDSRQIFIPLEIDNTGEFSDELLRQYEILSADGKRISGEKLFTKFISIIINKGNDFVVKKIDLKKLAGLMSQFTLSAYPKVIKELEDKSDKEKNTFGYLYLEHWEKCYSLESGFDFEKAKQDIIL